MAAHTSTLWRWSLRDLRAHWVKVGAIALVIALGTGGYAGLSSNAEWRRVSYTESYESLGMYDVRASLVAGSVVERGTLEGIAGSVSGVGAASERLLVPTQVEVASPEGPVLVRGEIMGVDVSAGQPDVARFHVFGGRMLSAADTGAPVAMLENNFALFYDLPDAGDLTVRGGATLGYVARATTPEYFVVSPPGELFLSEAGFAAVFTTLETAQALASTPGAVNDVVVLLEPGADRRMVVEAIESRLADAGVGAEVTTRDDNTGYTTLFSDIDNDQQMFNALAVLLFTGAVVAAYLMIHRMTQQQRREFGIAMALGVPPGRIALRPLFVSAQIAFLGVALGVGVGYLIGKGFEDLLRTFLPLPVWKMDFQVGLFAGVAVVGFLIPFAATAIPIWRATRVRPIEAIKPMHLSADLDHPLDQMRRRRRIWSTFTLMPWRNLRRAPWRTAFTTLAIAFVLTALVAFLGMLDTFMAALDTAEAESAAGAPDRVVVSLDGFYDSASPEVVAVTEAETVRVAQPTVRLGAVASSSEDDFAVLVEFLDLDAGVWHPSITQGASGGGGIVLSEEAASDLGLSVGDVVTLRHPVRTGESSFVIERSDVVVDALHPYPIRVFAYMDASEAGRFGLEGAVNLVHVLPADGAATGDVQRELFGVEAVASAESVTAATQVVRDQFEVFTGIFQMMAVVVLLIALLIAFLTASIGADARAREHATMFAFGVRLRTALRMAVTESFVMGAAATALGVLGGSLTLAWMIDSLIAGTLPEVGMDVVLRATTIVVVVVLGVVVVAIAPMFTARRLRRMDLPGTLRLME
jgi:putative ABC transport system permease protein